MAQAGEGQCIGPGLAQQGLHEARRRLRVAALVDLRGGLAAGKFQPLLAARGISLDWLNSGDTDPYEPANVARYSIVKAAEIIPFHYRGAIVDSELPAEVYLHLIGGRQVGMDLAPIRRPSLVATGTLVARPPRPHGPSEAELAAHAALLKKLDDPDWLQ